MLDLLQAYVSDLNKLREEFHNELTTTAGELSKALALYADRNDAALEAFLEKASARSAELEELAAARFNQFRGLPANGGLPAVSDGPPPHGQLQSDMARVAAAAERAVASGLLVESDFDRGPRPIPLNKPVEAQQAA